MTFQNLMRRNAALLLIGIALALLVAFGTLLQPALVSGFIGTLHSGESSRFLLLLLGVLLCTSIFAALQHYVVSVAADRAVYQMREELIERVVSVPLIELDKRSSGALVTRLTADASIVSTAISTGLVDLAGSAVVIVGAIIYMAALDFWLFAMVLAIILISALLVLAVSSKIEVLSQQVQDNLANLGSDLQQGIASCRAVKSLGAESFLQQRLNSSAYEAYKNRRNMSRVEAFLSPVSEFAVYASLIAVLAIGTFRVTNGGLPADRLAAFLTLLFVTVVPLTQFVSAIAAFREARGAVTRISEILQLPSEYRQQNTNFPTAHSSHRPGTITIRDLSFQYGQDEILANVSFDVSAGENVALMGASGSGKTTLLSLILGFYTADEGKLEVGGKQIERWDLRELRRFVSYVEQEPVLIPGSLEENLCLGVSRPPSEERLIEVLQQVGLECYATQSGLQTPIGDRNVGFSGGEKQKVAIARVLLRGSAIILVDEPTSALDACSRDKVLRTLLDHEATIVIVTHDESVASRCDRRVTLRSS